MSFILSHVCQPSGDLVVKTITLNQLRKGVPSEECLCAGLNVALGDGSATEDEVWLFQQFQAYLKNRKPRLALAAAIVNFNEMMAKRVHLAKFRVEVSRLSAMDALDRVIACASSAGYNDEDTEDDEHVQIIRKHLLDLLGRNP